MKLFGKSSTAVLTLGAAMLALAGKETVSAEEATAANEELAGLNIKGAQLITEAAFTDLSEKAERVEAAEKAASDAAATNRQLGEDLAAATARADKAEKESARLAKLPGAESTNSVRVDGKSDVEEDSAAQASQKAIDELPHNKALAGHPLFG